MDFSKLPSTPPDGWHDTPEGGADLYWDGFIYAEIVRVPGRDPPYATESYSPNGSRSLRNMDTIDNAKAHCERVTGYRAER